MHSTLDSLRTFVSGDKRRYTAEGFNLDLTYITPKLIAMGIPGKGLSTLWRNNVEEVGRFLDTHHPNNYRIFNLGKSTQNYLRLQNNSVWYGWPANRSPPLELLYKLVQAIDDYLKLDERNVAVIHCKEGRERSGVVIATYLLKTGVFTNHLQALDYYAQMRSKTREGVTTPSQIRYVEYMASIITHEAGNPNFPKFLTATARKLYVRRITLKGIPDYKGGFTPVVEVIDASKVPSETRALMKDFKTFQKIDFQIPIDVNFQLQGDVFIKIANKVNVFGLHPALNLFRVGFHTSFVPLRWTITRDQLDNPDLSGPVSDNRLRKGFTVEFIFTENPFDPLPVDSVPLPVQQQQRQDSVIPPYSQQQQNLNPIPPYNVQQQNLTPIPPYNTQESSLYPSTYSDSGYMPSNVYIPVNSTENLLGNNSMNSSMSSTESNQYQAMQYNNLNSSLPPPPVNRDTKDNRQALNNASMNVTKATDKLLQSVSSMPNIKQNKTEQQLKQQQQPDLISFSSPDQKTQI